MMYKVESLTINDLKEIIASGDDNHFNQIRITKDGYIYLSQDIVGAEALEDIAYRYETTDPHNDYVGIDAANDDRYVNLLYKSIKENWPNPKSTYIDNWNYSTRE